MSNRNVWKLKLKAFFHDPPHKVWVIFKTKENIKFLNY